MRAPIGFSPTKRGDDKIALMPSFLALGIKAGQRDSDRNDSACNQRPSTEASMHGPSPVAYWSASISNMVWSLAATVPSTPKRHRDTLTPSAPPIVVWASEATRRSDRSTNRSSEAVARALLLRCTRPADPASIRSANERPSSAVPRCPTSSLESSIPRELSKPDDVQDALNKRRRGSNSQVAACRDQLADCTHDDRQPSDTDKGDRREIDDDGRRPTFDRRLQVGSER